MAFESNLLRIDCFVGFKIVQNTACAPGPRGQYAPVVDLARLTLVDQADDARGQTIAVVLLNTSGLENRISPTFGKNLLLPARASVSSASTTAASTCSGCTCWGWCAIGWQSKCPTPAATCR